MEGKGRVSKGTDKLSYEAGLSDDTATPRKAASNLADSQCWKQHLSGQAQLSHSSLDSHNQNQEAMFTPQFGLYTKGEAEPQPSRLTTTFAGPCPSRPHSSLISTHNEQGRLQGERQVQALEAPCTPGPAAADDGQPQDSVITGQN